MAFMKSTICNADLLNMWIPAFTPYAPSSYFLKNGSCTYCPNEFPL